MKTAYDRDDDTLVIQLSDKPVVREMSQDWNIHVSDADDGSVVETAILDVLGRPCEKCAPTRSRRSCAALIHAA